MRLITFFILISLGLAVQSCGSGRQALVVQEASGVPSEKSLLWSIRGNNLKQTSFLFGTIHLIPEEDYFFPSEAQIAMESCSRITFEINLADMFDLTNMMGLLGQAFMPGGMTLRDLVSDEDYEMLRAHFEEVGIPFMFLDRIKPMFLSAFAEGDLAMGTDDGGVKSYELELFETAQLDGKEVSGLETIEYQMSIFDSIPYQVQAEMLVESVKASDLEGNEFQEMVRMYKSQDIQSMYGMIKGEGSLGQYEDMLLKNRNTNWIPVMKSQMAEKATFFAVGAGHLGGGIGVIALLRKEGYEVQPMTHILKL